MSCAVVYLLAPYHEASSSARQTSTELQDFVGFCSKTLDFIWKNGLPVSIGDDRCANHGVWQPREHVAVKKLVNGHTNR